MQLESLFALTSCPYHGVLVLPFIYNPLAYWTPAWLD